MNSFGNLLIAFGNYIFSFGISATGTTSTIPLWEIAVSPSKTDCGLVFGYPENTFFAHFMNIGN